MTTSGRPEVLLLASGDEREMLAEWLLAAGFDAVARAGATAPICSLVRWPVDEDVGALPAPVICLYPPGADVRPLVGSAQAVVALPDTQDVSSLLAWSKQLNALLREAAEQRDPASAERGCVDAAASAPADDGRVRAPLEPAALIAVGISTGGPGSLRELFGALPRDRSLPPMVVVQHIPPGFVEDLVARLGAQTGYDVRLAADGLELEAGVAYIAPGDRHLRVVRRDRRLFAAWSDAPPIRGHKPAVDELFASCAALGARGVAVVMTGMGRDGAEPMRALRDLGWETIGQDEESSVIYGMPRAALECGAVKRQLPLDRIAPWLELYCSGAAAPAR